MVRTWWWSRTATVGALAVLAACSGSDAPAASPYDSLEEWCAAAQSVSLGALSVPGVEGEDNSALDRAKRAELDRYVETYGDLGLSSSAVPEAATDANADYANEFKSLRDAVDGGTDIQELLQKAYANPDEGLFAAAARADEETQRACSG